MFKKEMTIMMVMSFFFVGLVDAHPDAERSQTNSDTKRFKQEHHRIHKGERSLFRLFSKLDLSDDQKNALKAIKEQNKDEMKRGHDNITLLKQQMAPLLKAESIDETSITDLNAQISELKSQHMIQKLNLKKQAVAILNEEQKVKLAAMETKREAHRTEHRKGPHSRN